MLTTFRGALSAVSLRRTKKKIQIEKHHLRRGEKFFNKKEVILVKFVIRNNVEAQRDIAMRVS